MNLKIPLKCLQIYLKTYTENPNLHSVNFNVCCFSTLILFSSNLPVLRQKLWKDSDFNLKYILVSQCSTKACDLKFSCINSTNVFILLYHIRYFESCYHTYLEQATWFESYTETCGTTGSAT